MGTSKRSGWRGAIRALAMLAIASGLVVGTATAAQAKQISTVKQLKSSCAKGGGTFTATSEGKAGICDVKGGYVICEQPTGKKGKCRGVRNAARSVVQEKDVRAAHGVVLTTEEVSDSHVWTQTLSISALTDVVCPSLSGDVVASADATVGACGSPTATIICTDASGTNCLGFAVTEKQADSIPKQIKTQVASAGSTPTSPTTSPTTSPNAPPTTKKCRIRGGCTPPTLPPGKAPGQSVPVAPQQNR